MGLSAPYDSVPREPAGGRKSYDTISPGRGRGYGGSRGQPEAPSAASMSRMVNRPGHRCKSSSGAMAVRKAREMQVHGSESS